MSLEEWQSVGTKVHKQTINSHLRSLQYKWLMQIYITPMYQYINIPDTYTKCLEEKGTLFHCTWECRETALFWIKADQITSNGSDKCCRGVIIHPVYCDIIIILPLIWDRMIYLATLFPKTTKIDVSKSICWHLVDMFVFIAGMLFEVLWLAGFTNGVKLRIFTTTYFLVAVKNTNTNCKISHVYVGRRSLDMCPLWERIPIL